MKIIEYYLLETLVSKLCTCQNYTNDNRRLCNRNKTAREFHLQINIALINKYGSGKEDGYQQVRSSAQTQNDIVQIKLTHNTVKKASSDGTVVSFDDYIT